MISDYFVLATPRLAHVPIPSPRGQSQPEARYYIYSGTDLSELE